MKLRIALIALLLAAGAAQAQSKKELVAKVIQLHQQGIENVGRMIAGQTSQGVIQAAAAAVQRLPADKRESVGKDVQGEIKKFYEDVEPLLRKRATELAPEIVAPAYEKDFSEDELKTLIAWLESPVSRKYAQIDRDMGNQLAQKVVADMKPTVEPKLKALEDSLSRKLGLPASGGSAAPAPAAPASAPKKKP